MIIKANQRGGAHKLALHLLNANDNEHIAVHEVRGFMSQTLIGAMNEADAVSRGARCKQPVFSVSLSPPIAASVPYSLYQEAAARIEEKMGLSGQPRVIVFHEKEGRQHAHVVWSRIDSRQMKAINLPFYKNKMQEIARELFLEHGWNMPDGLRNRENRNPLNFTLEEWQQAKRLDCDPKTIKTDLLEAWATSSTKETFSQSLEYKGFYLAKGDRRGYVAVDWCGEVFSLSRWLKQKSKDLQEQLGEPEALPSVDEVKDSIDRSLADQAKRLLEDIRSKHDRFLAPLYEDRKRLKLRHQSERDGLKKNQEERHVRETQERQARFRTGLGGLWDRLTGAHKRTAQSNESEARAAQGRDQQEQHYLRKEQLGRRMTLQKHIHHVRKQEQAEMQKTKQVIFSKLPPEQAQKYEQEFNRQPARNIGFTLDMG
jgi:hypothetical protein